jgi:hypothetical protein
MSDEQTFDDRLSAKIQKDIEAFERDPVARGQAALDRWWQQKLDAVEDHRRMMRELNPTGLRIW